MKSEVFFPKKGLINKIYIFLLFECFETALSEECSKTKKSCLLDLSGDLKIEKKNTFLSMLRLFEVPRNLRTIETLEIRNYNVCIFC